MSEVSDLRGAVLGKGYRLNRRLDDTDENEYEGTHERIPGRFVIRLFPVEILSQPESSSRIQRGARVASLLRDPHAVQILDFSASGDVPVFVVIERTPGRSLAAAMVEDGMAPLPRAVDLIASIATGLSAGHQIGLVHGDLRPTHIILSMSGQPLTRVSGFGWAKELRAAARVPAPSNYLAPEQDFGKVLALDERVDQFALAVLAYELIAGCLPFSVESADLAEKFGGLRTPPAIADMVPGVPAQIDEVLRRALSFTPSDRFGGLNEFITQLRAAATAGSTVVTSAPVVEAPKISGPAPIAETRGIATPTPILLSPGIVGATPAVRSDNDVTDELDLSTLGAVRPDGDGDEDEKLVLGPASGPAVTDDAKTQIRRSPFLNEGPETDEPGQGPPQHLASTPRRGVPAGRPSTFEGPSSNDSQRLASQVRSGVARAWLLSLGDRLAPPFWNSIKKRRAWTIPAVLSVALAVGVGVWMASASDDAPSTPPQTPPPPPAKGPAVPAAAVPTAPKPMAAAPQGTPASPAPSSIPVPAATSDHAASAAADPPSPAWPVIAPQPEPTPPGASTHGKTLTSPRGSARRLTRHALGRTAALDPSRPTAATSVPAADRGESDSRSPTGGPGDCSLHIVSSPWAYVWIDGKNTGLRTPVDKLRVPCGTRKLQLKRADKDIEQMEMLQVEAGTPFEGKYELK